MLFNSYVFVLAFFPVVLLGWYTLNHFKKYTVAKFFLMVASFVFYGYYNPWYLLIIIGSIVLNYGFSCFMLSEKGNEKPPLKNVDGRQVACFHAT